LPSVWVPRDEAACGLEAEAQVEHRPERLDLHLAEPGKPREVGAQLVAVGGIGPDAGGVAVVAVADVHGEVMHASRHVAGEAVDGGPDAEDRLEVGRRQRGGVDRAQALAQHERPHERLLHRDLLVEREPDQERHRVGGDEGVGLVGVGEVQAVGHGKRSYSATDEFRARRRSVRP
jgi:hypothetical protein